MPTFIDTKQDTAHTTSYFTYQKISYLAPRYLPSTRYLTVASYKDRISPPSSILPSTRYCTFVPRTGDQNISHPHLPHSPTVYLTYSTAQTPLRQTNRVYVQTNPPLGVSSQTSSEMRSDFAWRGKSARAAHRTSYEVSNRKA